jgi:DNA-binding transcriptional LysR family regulator
LTEAGTAYYRRALSIVDEVAQMNAETGGVEAELSGSLKMTMPLSFGLLHLSPLLDEFSKLHPKLLMEIDFVDRHVDLVGEGYELAIRIADLKDSSLKAKRLTRIRQVLCASPDYLKTFGEPTTLMELRDHDFLQYGSASLSKLQIIDPEGQPCGLQAKVKMKANNGDFLKAMAIQGQGITGLPTFIAYQALNSGELLPILRDHQMPELQAYAVYPQTRFLSQRCRLLIDFIAERFGEQPYWDDCGTHL